MNASFYSQCGEDRILAGIFNNKPSGTCMEIGALDGVKDSITLHFEEQGWSCILVEANPELAEKAKRNRHALVFSCAAGCQPGTVEFLIAQGAEYLSTMIATDQNVSRIKNDGATVKRLNVPVRRADDILQQAQVQSLDFVTVDVEGAELEVLHGFNLHKWKPRVLVVENNSGGHDRRVRRYLQSEGYRCFLNDQLNDWYAAKDDRELLTPKRVLAQYRRQIRIRLYEWTVGLLPVRTQEKIVKWKRHWLGEL